MKKIIMIMALVAWVMAAQATERGDATERAERGDTVVRYDSARSLVIVENEEGVQVVVTDEFGDTERVGRAAKGDGVVRRSHKFNRIPWGCCSGWDVVCGGLTMGFVTTGFQTPVEGPDMGKSMEIGWLNILGLERRLKRGWTASLGIGIDWRNYRSTRGVVYEALNGQVFDVQKSVEGYRFSRIKIFSLQFPLLFTKTFSKSGGLKPGLAIGPVFNYNAHGSVKTSWRDEQGKNRAESSSHIGQRKFTIDVYGQVTLGSFGVYARYSPYRILTGSQSPNYRSLSAGVVLFY